MEGHYRKLEGLYSSELIEVVRWCLQLDPLERPQSVFALQKALAIQAQPQRELTFMEKMTLKFKTLFAGKRKKVESDHTTIQESTLN